MSGHNKSIQKGDKGVRYSQFLCEYNPLQFDCFLEVGKKHIQSLENHAF